MPAGCNLLKGSARDGAALMPFALSSKNTHRESDEYAG